MSAIPRGLRNNNPGNIRKTKINWLGEIFGRDAAFETFSSMTYGVRALARNIISAQEKHDCSTVEDLINRWAPPNENDTHAYIMSVAQAIGVKARQPISVRDPRILTALVWAISGHENGPAACARYMNRHEVNAGVAMALED